MYVHLGSGKECKPKPWLNIDFHYGMDIPEGCDYMEWDLRYGLPRGLQGIKKVYSSHFFEHVPYPDALNLMQDCLRRMVPGAVFRMCVPDFAKTVRAYLDKNLDFFQPIRYASPNNRMHEYILYSLYQHGEHVCVYDAEFAIETLEMAGFKDVKWVPYDRTIDPDCDIRERYSVVVEGVA